MRNYYIRLAEKVATIAFTSYLGAWTTAGLGFDAMFSSTVLKTTAAASVLGLLTGFLARAKNDPNRPDFSR